MSARARVALLLAAALAVLAAVAIGARLLPRFAGAGELQFPQGGDAPQGAAADPARGALPAVAPEAPGTPVDASPARPVDPQAAARAERTRWNNEAIELLERGELERAVELLERCVAGEPGEASFRRNLAEALARLARSTREQGDAPRAIELLARAVELAPERTELAELLERWRAEAQAEDGFWSDLSVHFELSYDGQRDDLLQGGPRLIEQLEAIYAALRERLGADPAAAGRPRIRVVLYRREQFGAVTGLGDWAAGAFDGVVRVPIEKLAGAESELRHVLRHELAHAFVRDMGGTSVPGWLNEGLAQHLEESSASSAVAARERLRGAELFPLSELESSPSSWTDGDAIARAYAQSLWMVAELTREFGLDLVVAMVRGCAAGTRPEQTFEAQLGYSLESWLADLPR